MYRRFRFHHTLSSRPWVEGEIFVMGFPSSSPCGKPGFLPLSPSPGLFYRAETTLLNKLAFLSTTTGRFCSRCRISVCFRLCPYLTTHIWKHHGKKVANTGNFRFFEKEIPGSEAPSGIRQYRLCMASRRRIFSRKLSGETTRTTAPKDRMRIRISVSSSLS